MAAWTRPGFDARAGNEIATNLDAGLDFIAG